jgi:hypothetical protein
MLQPGSSCVMYTGLKLSVSLPHRYDLIYRNSRMPSADSVPQHVESTHVHHSPVPAHTGAQPISRQTLQALSAVPRSRFISNDMWMQAKKKPENQRSGGRESAYNYQHWLIQVCQFSFTQPFAFKGYIYIWDKSCQTLEYGLCSPQKMC